MTCRILSFLLLSSVSSSAFAQTKPTVTPADYGKWETLGSGAISPDGKWLAYEIRRSSGDGELRVAPTAGGKTQVAASCSGAAFASDSRWLACSATVSETEQDKLRKARKPVRNKLTLMDLAGGAVTTVDEVQSFAFAGEGPYLSFRKYPPTPAAVGGTAAAPTGGREGVVARPTRRRPSEIPPAPSCWFAT